MVWQFGTAAVRPEVGQGLRNEFQRFYDDFGVTHVASASPWAKIDETLAQQPAQEEPGFLVKALASSSVDSLIKRDRKQQQLFNLECVRVRKVFSRNG